MDEMEEEVVLCTEPPPPASSASRKRLRIERVEINDDDGFTMVQSKKKSNKSRAPEDMTSKRGNRTNNYFEVCVASFQLLPKQIGLAMLLKKEGITSAVRIKYKNPYRVVISFETKEEASRLLENKTFADAGFRCYLTSEVGITYGIVKFLEVDVAEEDLRESLTCDYKILTVKRLNRMSEEGQWVPSETVRFGFKSSILPSYLYGYGCRFKVDPYTFPVTQCGSCWKYGHLTRTCPTKRTTCPKCGGGHTNCETTELRCVNCRGKHMALSKSCPIYLKEKQIRSIMCQENSTYKSAASKYRESKARKSTPPVFTFGDVNKDRRFDYTTPTISYSQRLAAKVVQTKAATDFYESDVPEERGQSEVESKDSSEEGSIWKTSSGKKKKKKKNKERKLTKEASRSAAGPRGPQVPLAAPAPSSAARAPPSSGEGIKAVVAKVCVKVSDVLTKNISFAEKVSEVFKLFLDEFMSFVVGMISNGDVLTKLLGLFYNG